MAFFAPLVGNDQADLITDPTPGTWNWLYHSIMRTIKTTWALLTLSLAPIGLECTRRAWGRMAHTSTFAVVACGAWHDSEGERIDTHFGMLAVMTDRANADEAKIH
jgi:hypothetical protein